MEQFIKLQRGSKQGQAARDLFKRGEAWQKKINALATFLGSEEMAGIPLTNIEDDDDDDDHKSKQPSHGLKPHLEEVLTELYQVSCKLTLSF